MTNRMKIFILMVTVLLFNSCYDRDVVDSKDTGYPSLPKIENNIQYSIMGDNIAMSWNVPEGISEQFKRPLDTKIQVVENNIYKGIITQTGEGSQSSTFKVDSDVKDSYVILKLFGYLKDEYRQTGRTDQVFSLEGTKFKFANHLRIPKAEVSYKLSGNRVTYTWKIPDNIPEGISRPLTDTRVETFVDDQLNKNEVMPGEVITYAYDIDLNKDNKFITQLHGKPTESGYGIPEEVYSVAVVAEIFRFRDVDDVTSKITGNKVEVKWKILPKVPSYLQRPLKVIIYKYADNALIGTETLDEADNDNSKYSYEADLLKANRVVIKMYGKYNEDITGIPGEVYTTGVQKIINE